MNIEGASWARRKERKALCDVVLGYFYLGGGGGEIKRREMIKGGEG